MVDDNMRNIYIHRMNFCKTTPYFVILSKNLCAILIQYKNLGVNHSCGGEFLISASCREIRDGHCLSYIIDKSGHAYLSTANCDVRVSNY